MALYFIFFGVIHEVPSCVTSELNKIFGVEGAKHAWISSSVLSEKNLLFVACYFEGRNGKLVLLLYASDKNSLLNVYYKSDLVVWKGKPGILVDNISGSDIVCVEAFVNPGFIENPSVCVYSYIFNVSAGKISFLSEVPVLFHVESDFIVAGSLVNVVGYTERTISMRWKMNFFIPDNGTKEEYICDFLTIQRFDIKSGEFLEAGMEKLLDVLDAERDRYLGVVNRIIILERFSKLSELPTKCKNIVDGILEKL